MAKVYVLDTDGGDAERYDAIRAEMGLEDTPPGCRFHIAGPTPTGWRLVECWDDPAARERFWNEQVVPVRGRRYPNPPRVIELDVALGLDGPDDPCEVGMYGVFPGLSGDAFRAMDAKVITPGEVPDGLIRHVNGPHPDGWYIFDLWASEAKRKRFITERVEPVAPMDELSGPPRFELLPAHATMLSTVQVRT
jgi:hypothetical protein